MPGSNTGKSKAGKSKTAKSKTQKVDKKAERAKAQHVPQFINSGVDSLEAGADALSGAYQAYGDAYYKEFGLTAVKKATDKAFALVEKAIEMSKNNKFYDKHAGPWTGQF
jgi:hypothetical protein